MSDKRRLSCSEPEDRGAKRSKLSDTPDRDAYHWELLEAVRPIFLLERFATDLQWTSSNVTECDEVNLSKIRKRIRDFTMEMKLMEIKPQLRSGPPQRLREQQKKSYRQCLESLLDILNTFVREAILELPVVDNENDKKQSTQASKVGHIEPSQRSCSINQAFEKVKTTPSFTPQTENYPKLGRLARLANSVDKDNNQEKFCFEYVKTEHPVQAFEHLVGKTRVLNLFLDSITREDSGDLEPYREPRIPPTKWQKYDACTDSGSLYRALSNKLKDCKHGGQQHEVQLQLNGFELDSWASSSSFSVLFLWFTLEAHKEWTQHQCAPMKSYPGRGTNLAFINDICHSLRVSRDALKIHFFENDLFLIPEETERTSPGQGNNLPIVTLSTLLDQGYFKPIKLGGAFTYADKAVLTLSLGRCLLHLFNTPWTQQWSASNVHFLRKTHKESGCEEILNIHHPYLVCPLTRVEIEDFDLGHSHLLLLSFAQLLLEIETGDRMRTDTNTVSDSLEERLYPKLENLQDEFARGAYAAAVQGCLHFKRYFAKGYDSANRRTGEHKLALARQCLYEHIIKNLEKNFDLIPRPKRSLETRNLHLGKRQTYSEPFSVAIPDYVERMVSTRNNFHFDAHSTWESRHASSAKVYFDLFDIFRKQHILPTLEMVRRSRQRVKVAILDTGIFKDDPSIRGLISKGAKPESRGLPKKTRDPIVLVKDCLGNGRGDGVDTCGHGTHMAWLLMRFAPEADLYIYKISEGMEDNNPKDIVTAIKDAVENDVDIISMSFGFEDIPSEVETAIGRAYNRGACDKETALFAAASNNGLNTSRTFPANDNRVIGVHALDGLGKESTSINPAQEGCHDNLGTLGLGLRLYWKTRWEFKSGTSYATPIAAAIAVNILLWLGSVHDQGMLTKRQFDDLRRPHIVRRIMRDHLARRPNNVGDVLFVAPWHLWESLGPEARQEKVEEVTRDIIGILRHDYCSKRH